ncbi:MAG: PAS domain-containing protein [Ancalomicrobiaceae bacterium]|nr:PAS domain-containing protein [Ancalomicrobiaceae bacterium]
MSAVQTVLRDCGAAAGVGYWRFDSTRGQLHWPSGFGPAAKDASYGSWWSLAEFGQNLTPADRTRFFDYFENLFEPEASKSLDFPIVSAKGTKIFLRLDGAPIAGADQLLAAGIVRNVSRRVEAEDHARVTTALLEALAITISAGILIFDGQGRLRRANRQTFRLFGIEGNEGDEASLLKILGNRIPAPLLSEIADCRETGTAATGLLPSKSTPEAAIRWRANPFGRGGVVVIFEQTVSRAEGAGVQPERPANGKEGPRPLSASQETPAVQAKSAAPSEQLAATKDYSIDSTRSYLDFVHHPCLIIQTRDASIEFANRVARDKLGLKGSGKIHINNLFELSGRHAPHNVYVTGQRVSNIVTLPMGARVTRMNGVDPDLLFVEYL